MLHLILLILICCKLTVLVMILIALRKRNRAVREWIVEMDTQIKRMQNMNDIRNGLPH